MLTEEIQNSTLPNWLNCSNWATPRWKSAIVRRSLSMPVRLALERGYLSAEFRVLDFGCGRNLDVQYLQQFSILGNGFDPFWANDTSLLRPTDVVSCTYVINVIEDPAERIEVLKFAFSLAKRSLIIAVRTDGTGEKTTSTGTYQKYYTQSEFKHLLSESLGNISATFPKSGIAFIDKNSTQTWLKLG